MERPIKNQNANETDFDKQYKEDLEKATALSLETLALEEFHRTKSLQLTGSSVTDGGGSVITSSFMKFSTSQSNLSSISIKSNQSVTRPRPGSFGNLPSTSYAASGKSTTFPTSSSSGSLAPPPSSTQRNPNRNTSKPNDTDLISFSNPTESISNDNLLLTNDSALTTTTTSSSLATSPVCDSHSNFKQMVDEIHRRNAQFSSSMGYLHAASTSNSNASSMQLMPYTAQTGKTLNPDELTKLYNMNPYNRPMIGGGGSGTGVSGMVSFPNVPSGIALGHQPNHNSNIASQMSLAQANTNSAQYFTSTPYLQQQARGSMCPYAYQSSAGSPSIERPLLSAAATPNLYTQRQTTMTVTSMAMQQTHSSTFASNSSTNQETALAHLPNKEPISIEKKNIPFGQESTNLASKSTNKLCDNSNSGSSRSIVLRRTSTAAKQMGEDLIDLDNGIEDTLRVSVLEAFDPLLLNDNSEVNDQGDAASECGTSYYSECDPFDYLYSSGTQYSDPVYEAVIKIDRTPASMTNNELYAVTNASGQSIDLSEIGKKLENSSFTTPDWDERDDEFPDFTTISPTTSAPPLPPRNAMPAYYSASFSETNRPIVNRTGNKTGVDRLKVATKLYENVIENRTYDAELLAFYNMVKRVRSQFKYNDETTNVGHIVAAEYNNHYPEGTEIKLLVHPLLPGGSVNQHTTTNRNSGGDSGIEMASDAVSDQNGINNQKGQIEGYGPPVVFTCDICTTVEHVIAHVFCELEGQQCSGNEFDDYILKPIGVNEWLRPTSKLSQLDCVHQSIKLEQDVQFGLWPKTYANLNGLARTQQDDIRDADIKPEDILAHEPVETINYDSLMILLETLEDEIAKIESTATDTRPHITISQSGVVQAVKMICALFGSIDTLSIAAAIDALNRMIARNQSYGYDDGASSLVGGSMLEVDTEVGDYAKVNLRPKTIAEQIKYCCNRIRESVQSLIDTFSHAFRVDFCVSTTVFHTNPIPISQVSKSVMVHMMCLHRIPPHWKHDYYMLGAMIYHGTRYIGEPVVMQCSNEKSGLFLRNLKFDSWLQFDSIPICTLPRESRLIFVLYGCTTEPAEGSATNANNDATESGPDRKVTKIELGWSSIQFFDFERQMIEGSYLLPQWPPTTDKFLGPAPSKGTHPHGDHCPTLSINVPSYGGQVVFPEISQNIVATRLDFNSLDKNLQQELIDTAEQGYPSALDKREVLWEKRLYLHKFPHALPKILHTAHSWDYDSVSDLHALIRSWEPLSPLQALELFLPRYPDIVIREHAVRWMSAISNDQLTTFLPQLLQALKHDTYEASAMAEFLITRSLQSPRIAHHLYWLLVHCLPGDSPQNTIDQTQSNEIEEAIITMARYNRRNLMMLRALMAICGERLTGKFLAQNMMCKSLADVALNVKQAKESVRQKVLVHGMENVNQILLEQPTALPLSPSFEVTAVNSRSCGYFNSNTLPLKVSYIGPDRMILPAIFKAGDDLQQDMLTIQLVRVMDRLWLEEGIDLKMVTFECVPTGHKRGMIEMVTDAETLRKIQVEWGLTGSFKDKPIAEWLERQNPSQLEYQRAVDNFTVSCAGYSVVTYILGICDRHNDNIMLKTSGHLFHIDFGKFLGDAQMFGNFKRDRTPFVLTSDMAYVINMGDKPSIKFQHFVDLCCKAFNIVRKHGDLLLHMLALMATSGIPGVTADAVTYVRNALLPGQSNPEAAASFAKLIHISLKSWFTQFNFFLHNLAQMRFTGDECNGELLSFVPRTYTMAQDGRLKSVTVHGYQKRYDLEKYYTYILKVTRQNQPDPAFLFRSYKEFLEFHQKLCIHFPLAKLHSLSSGIHVGRSNIKTVAERRLPEIRFFLVSLFNSADEIAHSDLVYTFFHPILRDQQEQDINVAKVKDTRQIASPAENVRGEIKLSVQYHRGALTVMIYHARSLPPTTGGQEPNTYVKAYLKPDPTKMTKRKTKVVRKNCFPSFMETLEYRMPLENIQNRLLQVTVWTHDSLQENEFLGGVELSLGQLDLREEFIKWFPLGYVTRS